MFFATYVLILIYVFVINQFRKVKNISLATPILVLLIMLIHDDLS